MLLPFAHWLFILVGHFGLHLTFYNRINATGLKRWQIKLIERSAAVECFLFPALIYWYPQPYYLPDLLKLYGWVCLASIVVLGIPWLIYRPIFGYQWLKVERKIRVVDVAEASQQPILGTWRIRLNARLPMNQITQLAIEEKAIPVSGLPDSLNGLRIAHFSDVHLTGDMLPAFYRYVADQIMQWEPELVCLTGDIIDKTRCIEWLDECFGTLAAPAGCYFILGNHDDRVIDPEQIRQRMESLGWINVGSTVCEVSYREANIFIAGNERPWFGTLPDYQELPDQSGAVPRIPVPFRLLLSHSPDQIDWARDQNVNLMLAGHTHGGHGRLPLIGPLLSPSHYGSRFASGEFYLAPTTMHVTRGLFGTHMQRIRCLPELSLLTLYQSERINVSESALNDRSDRDRCNR